VAKTKTKIDNFETCITALDFIDELSRKNKNCHGYLTNTPKIVNVVDSVTGKNVKETTYIWHVEYNPNLLKEVTDVQPKKKN
jgi:hypothetical protein